MREYEVLKENIGEDEKFGRVAGITYREGGLSEGATLDIV